MTKDKDTQAPTNLKTSNWTMTVVVMTVMIDSMGIGIVIPVTPDLLMDVLPGATMAEASPSNTIRSGETTRTCSNEAITVSPQPQAFQLPQPLRRSHPAYRKPALGGDRIHHLQRAQKTQPSLLV